MCALKVVWPSQLLAEKIGRSRAFVQTIRKDSSDIVSVIRQAYEVYKYYILLCSDALVHWKLL